GRAVLPESARGEVGGDAGLSLNPIGSLTTLVAEIAARGSRKGSAEGTRDKEVSEKNATAGRFRRQEGQTGGSLPDPAPIQPARDRATSSLAGSSVCPSFGGVLGHPIRNLCTLGS